MRFAVQRQNGGGQGNGLSAQQQKIFDMNNHPHGVVGMQGAQISMAYAS